MVNGDFESKTNKQDSTDAGQKSAFNDTQQNTEDHLKGSSNTRKQRQKKTGVALSVITCLFLCVVGYEIIRENQTAVDEEGGAKGPEKKPLQIIGRDSSAAAAPVLSAQTDGPNSYDTYQIKLLVEQNRLQAEKIKQLRDELLSTTQRLHDIKPNLFTKSNAQDLAKIADLSQQLAESEELRVQLALHKENIDSETRDIKKKLNEMGVIKDSLAAMVETLRAGKEQEQQHYIKQIDEIRFTTSAEKNALLKKIHQHENSVQKLTQAVDEKSKTIERLDQEVQKQNILLAFKSEELQDLHQQMLALYENILVMTDIDAILHAKMSTEIENLAANLQQEQERAIQLLADNEEIHWLVDLFALSQKTVNRDMNDLITALEWESAKNHELGRLKEELLDLKLEMHQLSDTYALSKAQMNERVQDIVAALQIEELYNRELSVDNKVLKRLIDEKLAEHLHMEGEMQTLSSAMENEKKRIGELQHELFTSFTHHESENTYALELELLIADYVTGQAQLEAKVEKLTLLNDQAKSRVHELQQELFVALMHHENENHHTNELQGKISEHLAANSELQEAVSALQASLKEQQERNTDLQQKYLVSLLGHEEESAQSHEFEQRIQQNFAAQEELQKTIASLQQTIEHHGQVAQNLQNHLALAHDQHEQDHIRALLIEQQLEKTTTQKTEMEETVIQLQTSVEKHEQRGLDLLDELLIAFAHHEEENSYAAELEREIEENRMKQNQLRQEIVQFERSIEHQKNLTEELNQKLSLNAAHSDGQQREMAALKDQIKDNEAIKVSLTETIDAMVFSLETEKMRNQGLQQDLENAADLEKHQKLQMAELDGIMQHYLDVQVEMKESIASLQSALDLEKRHSMELQQFYHDVFVQREGQNKEIEDLQQLLAQHLDTQEVLRESVASFQKNLDSQKERAQDLEHKFLTALSNHEVENQYAQELENLIEKNRASNAAMQETIYAMTVAMDREKQRSEELQHQLLVAQSHQDEENARASALEASLKEKEELHKNELQLAQQLHENKERQLLQQLQNALENYKTEQGKALTLEMFIQDTSKNVAILEAELHSHKTALDNKHQELTVLAEQHMENEKGFLIKLEGLNNEFGQEKSRAKEIQENLEHALAKYDEAREKAELLEGQLRELSHQISEKDQSYHLLKQQLSATSQEHQHLRNHHKEITQEKDALEQRYILELHKLMVQDDLMQKLQEDLKERSTALQNVTQLKEDFAAQKEAVEKKRKEMEDLLNKEIEAKNTYSEQIGLLKTQLEQKQLQTKNLESHLVHLQNLYRSEQEGLANLEQIQDDTAHRLQTLEKELAAHREMIASKNLEIQTLSDAKNVAKSNFKKQQEIILNELDSERNKAKAHQDELEKTLASYKQEQNKVHELEQKAGEQQQASMELDLLKNKLTSAEMASMSRQVEQAAMDQQYDDRIKDLEGKLQLMRQIVKEKENEYKSLANRLADNSAPKDNSSSSKRNPSQDTNERRLRELQDRLQKMERQSKEIESAHQTAMEKVVKLSEQNRQLKEEKEHALVEKASIEQKYLKELKTLMQKKSEDDRQSQQMGEANKGSMSGRQMANSGRTYQEQKTGQFSERTHMVAEGDTLRIISKMYYGTPNRWKIIFQANRDKIPDENRLKKGTVLVIPSTR
jgi:nucleoid-associated protein YgaU